MRRRRTYDAAFRARVALEAIKNTRTLAEISGEYKVHPNMIIKWKKEAISKLPLLFQKADNTGISEAEEKIDELYREIGKLKVESDYLKKKTFELELSSRKSLIDITHETLSINQQCKLLSIPHSSFYFQPATESPLNLKIMKLIDRQHTLDPVRFGQMKLVEELTNTLGIPINRKRVQRLMRLMGIEGEYQKPRTTISSKNHKIYPYLLRDYAVLKPDEVWSTDITYIAMRHGFMYLTAIIDWYSRYVISWELSNTLETDFCSKALNRALNKNKPLIFNTDQGSQFTSNDFTSILANHDISISMDGRGRSLDNIFIERLWRTLKYENIYRHSYETVKELMESLRTYFNYYNKKRIHQSLNYNTPASVYFSN